MSLVLLSKAMRAQLPPAQKLVLLVLADFAEIDGTAWPTVAQVASQSGQCTQDAIKALLALSDAGVIAIMRPDNQPAGSPNRYRINFAELDALSRGDQS